MTTVDPATFEVVWHRLLDVTEEMGIKYMRTSGSPILVGAYDASTAICLPDGQLVAMGPYITTQAHVVRGIVEATIRMRSENPGIRATGLLLTTGPTWAEELDLEPGQLSTVVEEMLSTTKAQQARGLSRSPRSLGVTVTEGETNRAVVVGCSFVVTDAAA